MPFHPPTPDGGGSVDRSGSLILTPAGPTNLGNVVVASSASITFIAKNEGGGNLDVISVVAPGAEWALAGLPVFPKSLAPGASFSFTLTLTPASAGAKTTTVDIAWSDAYGDEPDVTSVANGTGTLVGGAAWIPAGLSYSTTQVGRTSDQVVVIKNVSALPFNLTALAFTGGVQFALVGPPVLPLALAAGASQSITVRFAPITVGPLSDVLTATTDVAGTAALSLNGFALLVVPIAICANNDRRVIIAGFDASGLQGQPAPLITSPNSFNSEQSGSLTFNGSIWQGMGVEKTLFRLGFYYENLGVAILSGTVSCFRPQQGADVQDSKPFVVTLGTALADGSTRYAEVDIVATGELLFLTLNRAANSGPVSLCAIVPYFAPRGEKVKDV